MSPSFITLLGKCVLHKSKGRKRHFIRVGNGGDALNFHTKPSFELYGMYFPVSCDLQYNYPSHV